MATGNSKSTPKGKVATKAPSSKCVFLSTLHLLQINLTPPFQRTESPAPKERKLPLVSYTRVKEKTLVEWLNVRARLSVCPLRSFLTPFCRNSESRSTSLSGRTTRSRTSRDATANGRSCGTRTATVSSLFPARVRRSLMSFSATVSSSDHKSKKQLLAELARWEKIHDQAPQTTAKDLGSDYEVRSSFLEVVSSRLLRPPAQEEHEDAFRDLTRAMKARSAHKPAPSPPPIAVLSSPTTPKATTTSPDPTTSLPSAFEADLAADPLGYLSPSPSRSSALVDSPPFTVPPPFPRPEEDGRKRARESSPFDPEGPRPSQRIREEEWGDGEDEDEEDEDEDQDVRAAGVDMDVSGTGEDMEEED